MAGLVELTLLTLALAVFIAGAYALHRKAAPRPKDSRWKRAPYACGESLPPEKVPVKVQLFKYVCLFLVFDVTALLFATAVAPLPPLERVTVRLLLLAYGVTLVTAVLAVSEL